MKLNFNAYLFILPVAFSWPAIGSSPQLIVATLIAMGLAETLRQYLAYTFVREPETPRQLFFFGVIYQDSPGLLSRGPALPELSRSRKLMMLAGVYIVTFGLRFSPAFEALEMLQMALFSLILTFWINSTSWRSLGRVLLLQVLAASMIFITNDEASPAAFMLWLAFTFWTQSQLHRWQIGDEEKFRYSGTEFLKPLILVLVLVLCFRTADFLVPDYANEVSSGASVTAEGGTPPSRLKKSPALPKKVVQNLAKMKLQADNLDFQRALKLGASESRLKSPGQGGSAAEKLSFGENHEFLEEMRKNLKQDTKVNQADLETLKGLSKKINLPAEGATASDAPDNLDKSIEERIEKIKSLQEKDDTEIPPGQSDQAAKEREGEDDAEAYLRSRRELADEVDKLISRDELQTLAREEMNLQRLIDKIKEGLKRFSFVLILSALLAYWLSRKKSAVANAAVNEKSFALPKEVRLRLKTLYKMLLSGNFSAKEEVLKSFYIVELAFKEIDFGRDEALPPHNFLEKLGRDLPFVYTSAKTPIDLFSSVFYGDKNPDQNQMKDLRSSMQSLMKKLQVI